MYQPKLEMRHLRMLQVMAQTGSVTEAASKLGVTQSAISHQIREIERKLNVHLFIKREKRMVMTPVAETLNGEAGRILAQIERIESEVGRRETVARHVVRIGCGAYSGYRWLPRFMKAFQDHSADIDIEVVADATRQPLNALTKFSIDIAVSSGTPAKATTRSLLLFRDELILIMAPDHPLASRPFVVAQDLADLVFISYSDIVEKGHEYERFLKPAHVIYRKMLRVELTEAIVELVIGGFGVSILSRWAVLPHLRSGALAEVKVSRNGLFVNWHAVTRKKEGATSPAWRMATALRQWCEDDPEGFGLESKSRPTEPVVSRRLPGSTGPPSS